ncbi:MAG: hypothetical protein IPJ88_15950 [Myxococcales bacterium]|nr:MAG: hypothetical protein IPJ88_15950 [Myxococcales bacterium]
MREQLEALAKLSEIDNSAREVETELRALPARIEEMVGNVERLERLLSVERDKLAEATRLREQHAQEVSQGNEQLAKAKSKMARAQNAREAEAAEREMESLRRNIRDREQEREKLNTAIDQVNSSLASHEGELEELKNSVTMKEKRLKLASRNLKENVLRYC